MDCCRVEPRDTHYDPSLPSAKYVQLTERMPRKLAVILLQLCIGSTNTYIESSDSPICPCCHREDERVFHYLMHCPAHANARAELHRLGGRDARVLDKLLTQPKLLPLLFQFIACSGRFRTVFGEIPVLPPFENPTRRERFAELAAVILPAAIAPLRLPRNIGPDWVPPV